MHNASPALALILLTTPAFAQPPAPGAETDRANAPFAPVSRDTTVRFRVSGWQTQAGGDLRIGEPIPGAMSTLDIEDTLGLDTEQFAGMATLGFNLGTERRWHLDLGYTGHFEYEGESDPITISFNDRVYTGVVESRAEFDMYELTLSYDLIRTDRFTLAVGGGARVFDLTAEVSGTATDPGGGPAVQRTDEEGALVPIPAFGLGARFDVTEHLYLRGSARGVYAGDYGSFLDASAEIGFDFSANIGLYAGYRLLRAEADVEDVEFDLRLHGAYAGVEIRF
ncbi:MAG: hypothetical protein WD749_06210 [Phycisphaerales bacterium]